MALIQTKTDTINAEAVSDLIAPSSTNKIVKTVATIANLNFQPTFAQTVNVLGYATQGDGGEGTYVYDSTYAQANANGSSVIDPTGTGTGTGCWVKQSPVQKGSVNVLDYIPLSLHSGIKAGTNTVDLSSYIQNALDLLLPIVFTQGTYLINSVNIKQSVYGYGATITGVTNNNAMFVVRDADNIEITGLIFDEDVATEGKAFISIGNCENIKIHHNTFLNSTFYCVTTHSTTTDDLHLEVCDGIFVHDNYFKSTRGVTGKEYSLGFEFKPKAADGTTRLGFNYKIYNNIFDGKFINKLQNIENALVDSNLFVAPSFNQAGSGLIELNGNNNLTFSNNTLVGTYSASSFGLIISDAVDGSSYTSENIYVSNFNSNSTSNTKIVDSTGVHIKDSSFDTIRFVGDTDDIIIDNCKVGSVINSKYAGDTTTVDTISNVVFRNSNVNNKFVVNQYNGAGNWDGLTIDSCKISHANYTWLLCKNLRVINSYFKTTASASVLAPIYIYGDGTSAYHYAYIKGNVFDGNATQPNGIYTSNISNIIYTDNTVRDTATAEFNNRTHLINTGTNTLDGIRHLSGTASPVSSVIPDYIGQEYLDTVANKWYKSHDTTSADWVALN